MPLTFLDSKIFESTRILNTNLNFPFESLLVQGDGLQIFCSGSGLLGEEYDNI